MKNKIKTKRSLVPVIWTDVRLEGLKINHLIIKPGSLHWPQPPAEIMKCAIRVSRGFVPELAQAFGEGIKEFNKATVNTSKEINAN